MTTRQWVNLRNAADNSSGVIRVVPSGAEVELVAAEPDVIDPVAMRFDEDGRLWVAEYRDYPLGPPAGGAPFRPKKKRPGGGRLVFGDRGGAGAGAPRGGGHPGPPPKLSL